MEKEKNKNAKSAPFVLLDFVDDLFEQNLISAKGRKFALSLICPPRAWETWTSRLLLFLGVVLTLAGILFFFAFNWEKLGRFEKLGLIEGGVVICLAALRFFPLKTLIGKVLSLSASVLVGVFLAVFGQVYQTGADAYTLFAIWTALILPWVVLTSFPTLWFFWFVLAEVSLATFWTQAVLPAQAWATLIFPLLALGGVVFLIVCEVIASRSQTWKQNAWIRALTALPVLGLSLVPILSFILRPAIATVGTTFGFGFGLVLYGGFYFAFRWKLPDRLVLTATVFGIATAAATAGGKILSELIRSDSSAYYFLLAVIILGVSGLAIRHLQMTFPTMGGKNG